MNQELWDSYNIQGQKLGFDLVRGEKIPQDVYHLVVDIIVRHVSDHSYLLLQRDFNKVSNPGLWEIGAGGAAIKGEEPLDAALRELKEESGIEGHDLKEIYDTVYNQGQSLHVGYECVTDIHKQDIILQATETIRYRWITPKELIKFYHSSNCIKSQRILLKDYMEGLELIYKN